MLVPDSEMPGGERAKVLDFGIAKGVTEYSGPASEEYRTNTGMVLGTATYMAPEQCKGAGNVTPKADVYSLGVMMYRMCCGQLPFRAEGQGEVMAMHIFSQARPLREHDVSIPEPLADLVARMMHKDPADRPSMVDVAHELEKLASPGSAASQPVVVMVGSPAADNSGVSSTLSAALGQSGSMKGIEDSPPPAKRGWLLGTTMATVALVLVGLGVRYGLARVQATTVVQQGVVVWAFNSHPDHAQVLRQKDGKELCRTPCSQEPEPGVGRLTVIFRAPGYDDEEIVLDEAKPFASPVKLRLSAGSVPPTAPPPTAEPLEPGKGKEPAAATKGSEPPTAGTTDPTQAAGTGTRAVPADKPPEKGPETAPDKATEPGAGPPTTAPRSPAGQPPKQLTDQPPKQLTDQPPSQLPNQPPGKQPGGKAPGGKRPGPGKSSDLLTDDKIQIIE